MNYYSQLMSDRSMQTALLNSSVSAEDARLRGNEYAKMFSRNEELMDTFGLGGNGNNLLQKTFSGYAETPLLSTQYFNASVASYVSSFAGFLSIERDFDQPNGLFYWFDVLGVTDLRPVIPNLGPDDYMSVPSMGQWTQDIVPSKVSADYSLITGSKMVPGTIRVKIFDGTKKFELIDNGQGVFMSVAGVLTESSINYINGQITFKLANILTDSKSTVQVVGKEDATGSPTNHAQGAGSKGHNERRFLAKMNQLGLSTVPDMLVAEYNIAALGAMKKATGSDMATFLFTKLRELYTKNINYKLVTTIEDGYRGDVMADLDLSNSTTGIASKFMDYRSRVDLFDAYLVDVEAALATKAVKGVNVTTYLAGNNASNQFQKGSVIGKWESNKKSSYINDLLGWYDGIPVLRSTDLKEEKGEGTFYAVHKTQDGQMAPAARGIYMPLTDTPTIGNYNNPTQMASGIYYQEGVRMMADELVQKVTFKVGF